MVTSKSPVHQPPSSDDSKSGEPASEDKSKRPISRSLMGEIGAQLVQSLRKLRGSPSLRESLEKMIEDSERSSQDLSSQERFMLRNLLKVGALRVEDVMVPRADIIAVEENTSLPALLELFREAQHSRLPIYSETLDDPRGMVHVKDVLGLLKKEDESGARWQQGSLSKIRRDVIYVPAAMPVLDLLLKMQASHIHLALVVDEYGGTDGLVSIENLVEEIVGDIDDQHDVDEEPQIIETSDGSFDADARAALDDFFEKTGIDLTQAQTEDDVDTLGGLIFAELGRVPVRGEIVVVEQGFEFEVLEADARRVKRLRIRPASAERATVSG
jgi:magnesium and cobalt transporter